jgi:hypothetical protein
MPNPIPRRTREPTYTFTVEGDGAFPFDMLRYDCCWPYYPKDATALKTSDDYAVLRRVVLESCAAQMPTRRRWESKGWRVVEVGYPDENSRKVKSRRHQSKSEAVTAEG